MIYIVHFFFLNVFIFISVLYNISYQNFTYSNVPIAKTIIQVLVCYTNRTHSTEIIF